MWERLRKAAKQASLCLLVTLGPGAFSQVLASPITALTLRVQAGMPVKGLTMSQLLEASKAGLLARAGWSGFENGLRLYVYNGAMGRLESKVSRDMAMVGAGAISGLTQALTSTPVEQYAIRRSLSPETPALQILKSMLGSVRLFWRGVVPCAGRDVLFGALLFYLKSKIPLGSDPLEQAVAGGVSGAVCAFLVTPMDTIKTRLQAGLPALCPRGFIGLLSAAPYRFFRSGGMFLGVFGFEALIRKLREQSKR